jgi:hypothetical protein
MEGLVESLHFYARLWIHVAIADVQVKLLASLRLARGGL